MLTFFLNLLPLCLVLSFNACDKATDPEEQAKPEVSLPFDPSGLIDDDEGCSDNVDMDNKQFKVLSPNGGEVLQIGDTLEIHFCGSNNNGEPLMESYKQISVDGGENWHVFENFGDPNDFINEGTIAKLPLGEEIETEDGTLSLISDQVKIMVYDYQDESINDESDATFTIKAASSMD